jgi:hypothetical protein
MITAHPGFVPLPTNVAASSFQSGHGVRPFIPSSRSYVPASASGRSGNIDTERIRTESVPSGMSISVAIDEFFHMVPALLGMVHNQPK